MFERFFQIPRIERELFIKGYIFSFCFALIVLLLPLKTYISLLKSKSFQNNDKAKTFSFKILVCKTIRRIKRFSIWNCTCLNKALTAKYLYKNLGISSEIKLVMFRNGNGLLNAHAFLKISELNMYLDNLEEFTVLKF
ncbi:MAG: lasso peptide biosynthesis B2 protein [Bacteroidales bacterium]|nr:lasso peptide biosynthesis B2 protein [Bacteroidales bacterium]